MAWHTNPGGLQKRARKAFGEWLAAPLWQWYVTQTFRAGYVSPRQADHSYYAWLNALRVAARGIGAAPALHGRDTPFYFRVTELQDRGTLHFHSLIGGVGNVSRLFFKDLWELNGISRVLPYESNRGANFYVGKYLTKTDGDIRFSDNLKPHLT